jgi:hypothetical protein
MRVERMDGIASKRRDQTVEENLKRFAEMKAGSEEGLRWCIRAKMSVDNPNKAMRDPVIYRCNILSHHRTGYACMPTYMNFVLTEGIGINGRSTQPTTSLALSWILSRVSRMHFVRTSTAIATRSISG